MEAFYSKDGIRIPRPVLMFFLKAFALFIGWKALYMLVLLPGRVLDRPLTRFIGTATAVVLNTGPGSAHFQAIETGDTSYLEGKALVSTAMDLRRGDQQTLRVADACNGLELLVLYAGFIICFPAPMARKVRFILSGMVLICLLNIVRCAALVVIFLRYNKYLDFSHHFAFNVIVYGFIFLLWYFFIRKMSRHERSA